MIVDETMASLSTCYLDFVPLGDNLVKSQRVRQTEVTMTYKAIITRALYCSK